MAETAPAPRAMRADARRNYDRLLSAARGAVAARGADIVLEDIAKSAGVAIGTLYRHFPTRQDLLEAVFVMRPKHCGCRRRTRRCPGPFRRPGALAAAPDGLRGARTEHGRRRLGGQACAGNADLCGEQSDARGGRGPLGRAQAAGQSARMCTFST